MADDLRIGIRLTADGSGELACTAARVAGPHGSSRRVRGCRRPIDGEPTGDAAKSGAVLDVCSFSCH